MAVWGTPTATEDDAERAVRAALDLVAAVSALGDEAGEPELRARAGVLTGEAAVTVGAEGQGMVAGDLVNTASRIQSLSEPGTVLVGEPDPACHRPDDRLRRCRLARAEGKDRPVPALAGAPCRLGRARVAQVHGARSPLRRPRQRAPPRQGSLPRVRGRRQAAADLDHRDRRHRQVASRRGSSTSTWTGCRRCRTGTAAAASRTARASPTGPSPTWCAMRARIAEDEEPRVRAREARGRRPRARHGRRGAPLRRAAAHAPARSRGERAVRAGRPLCSVAPLHRAPGRRLPGHDGLRGHAVGGHGAARLRRVPARVVP